jgi:pimeloyl-ACP methyl ester carboxylesterase
VTSWPDPATIDLGRETLAVYDYGPPAGASLGDVVMLHGMADVARSLEPLAEHLHRRYRVVLFDARGHGRSSHPGAYSALHYVADLHAFLDRMEIGHPILIGHSLGGHTVANYGGLFPERPRALVLLEGLGPPTTTRPATPEARLAHTRTMIEALGASPRHRAQPDLVAAAERLLVAHPRLDPARARVLADEGTEPGPDGGVVWRHDERTWHWVTSIDQATLEERWAAITVPVLAVSGVEAWDTWWTRTRGPAIDREKMSDEELAERLAIFADLHHVELTEAGHMVHFDRPDRLNQLIDEFLRTRVER